MNTATLAAPPRSARLSSATDALHQDLHTLVSAASPFHDRERYARFAAVQYHFQSELEPLYQRPSLQALLPGLALRSRREAVMGDLLDLNQPLPATQTDANHHLNDYQALGWLFVSEGSTLGAAVLLKRAQALGLSENFGARYLAPSSEGRARHWKQFIEALDGLDLKPEEDAQIIAGARTAFQRFAQLITRTFQN